MTRGIQPRRDRLHECQVLFTLDEHPFDEERHHVGVIDLREPSVQAAAELVVAFRARVPDRVDQGVACARVRDIEQRVVRGSDVVVMAAALRESHRRAHELVDLSVAESTSTFVLANPLLADHRTHRRIRRRHRVLDMREHVGVAADGPQRVNEWLELIVFGRRQRRPLEQTE